ncbi:hypothetical protein [Alysiella crassa]|uniref:Uncharacterized protein n=1 Tax=Alysiella crassa TaxID=153491 RepID=A0A376BLF6_9NEIS|nr:hypothetical protein [Alysiella crassa]UOP07715.1 hypothetical protein LVJ80_05010 [Alysiella crassa]SSY70044.1 Uncharacterised protein [Alysiella crassa]
MKPELKKTMEQGFFATMRNEKIARLSKPAQTISVKEAQKLLDEAKRELEEKRFAENAARMREHMQMARQHHEIGNQVMAIRAIFGDMPFNEILFLLQEFIRECQEKQAKQKKQTQRAALILPETPAQTTAPISKLARENGRKGKEKQLQNSVKEKFRLNKFQDLFKIWETRLRREEYGAKARFCETVKMYYDDYIDALEKQGAKINEKDKVLTDDAIRRWLRKLM